MVFTHNISVITDVRLQVSQSPLKRC